MVIKEPTPSVFVFRGEAGTWLTALVGEPVAISDSDISRAPSAYLECYPDEAALLSEPVQLLS